MPDRSTIAQCFPDKALAQAIASEVKGDAGRTGAVLTSKDVKDTTVLNLYASGVSSVQGLQVFTNLQILELQDTGVSDVSPLSKLVKLESLELSATGVSDVSPLSKLTKLEDLDLMNTGVSDVSPLSKLTDLKDLNLSGTQVSDVSSLSKLTKLERLVLEGTGVSDVSPLSKLTKLTTLWLDGTRVSDVSPLSKLTKLESLWLYDTRVSDVSPLSKMTNLKDLSLQDTRVSDVSPLSKMTNLESLGLYGTRVSDVSPLSKLVKLDHLYLGNTGVSDVSPLSKMTNLKTLSLDNTRVSDVSPLSKLTKLKDLNLSGTRVLDVSPLSKLPLDWGALYGSSASNVRPSVNLTVNADGSVSLPAPRWTDGSFVAPSSTSPAGGVLDAKRGVVTWKGYDAKASYSYDFDHGGVFSGHVTGVKPAPTPKVYVVSFDSQGGSGVASQRVTAGQKASRPADPARSGFAFAGWYTAKSGGSKYDFGKPVTGDLTLYARWTKKAQPAAPKVYVVSFDSQGGSGVASQRVTAGRKASRPADPARSGFAFAGWYTAKSGGSEYDFGKPVTRSLTLYARWARKAQPAAPTVAMFRLYNPNSGEHFYTGNAAERDHLAAVGWKSEGVGWAAPAKSGTPVYRMYNPNAGDHHYTMNKAERDMLVKAGWRSEGVGWYSAENQGRAPLYREYNPNARAGAHNYTLNKAENDMLVRAGWRAEGIAWYAVHA